MNKEDDNNSKPIAIKGKFQEYLSSLLFDETDGKASVTISFPLDFKKVLMLTIAESTM